jgi:hypothetical protein
VIALRALSLSLRHVAAATALGLLAASPEMANAYVRSDDGGTCPQGIAWTSQRFANGGPRFDVAIDSSKYPEIAQQKGLDWSQLGFLERAELVLTPFYRIHDAIEDVRGSAVVFDSIGIEVPVTAPSSGDPGADILALKAEIHNNGDNDVLFSDLSTVFTDIGAITFTWVFNGCRIVEADIIFFEPPGGWRFFEPEAYGVPYWNDSDLSEAWMQTTYLHEMMHALGFGHTSDTYSQLNYGTLPWTRHVERNPFATVDPFPPHPEPLPDDRLALRDVYPESGDEFDLAVSNTWFSGEPEDVVANAAEQFRLCLPSVAPFDLANPSQRVEIDPLDRAIIGVPAETCTVYSGPVCPGDVVGVAYVVSNNGVAPEWVEHELWFSLDDELDAGDAVSLDVFSVSGSDTLEESSRLYTRYVEVPAGLAADTEFHVLVRVQRLLPHFDQPGHPFRERTYANNWIPLRGTIRTTGAGC